MIEDKLAEIFNRELSKINDGNYYKKLFTINNNLDKFNIVNRMLILGQYPKAFDVKSRLQWSAEGRNIKEGAKPIFVFNPIVDYTYKFVDTGERLRNGALNPIEIANSVEMGIIVKDEDIIGASVDGLYDIRDTELFDGTVSTKTSSLKTNVFNLLSVAEVLVGLEVSQGVSEDIKYFKKTKQLFIPKISYKRAVSAVVDIIVDHLVYNVMIQDKELQAVYKNNALLALVIKTAGYSIKTKFGVVEAVDFKADVADISIDDFIDISSAVEIAVSTVTELIPSDNERDIRSSLQAELFYKKAENLANIMEANIVNKAIRE